MEALAVVLATSGLISAILNTAVVLRIRRQGADQSPSLTPRGHVRPGSLGQENDVSVLIPARDEEKNIGACASSALAQEPCVREVIVYDDGSRDGTAAIVRRLAAADPRVRLLEGGDVPPGWTGKCNAMHRLAAAARGSMLLFLDADTRLAPGAVEVAMDHMRSARLDAMSCVGHRERCTVWDDVWEPLWPSLLYCATGRLDLLGAPGSRRRFASGAWMSMSRDVYARVGGYAPIKAEVVEDCAMAGRISDAGLRVGIVNAPELYSLRMYDGLAALWRGWTKNVYRLVTEMLGYPPSWFVAGVVAVLWMTVVPFLISVASLGLEDPLSIAAAQLPAAFAFGLWAAVRRAVDRRPAMFFTLPVSGLLVAGVLATSALRAVFGLGVTWKERHYV